MDSLMKYLKSIILGILGTVVVILLMPAIAILVFIAGFTGQLTSTKEQTNEK